jgi:peptide/nickel transport system permease protein
MLRYVARRALLGLVTVLTAVLISFVLVHITRDSPGEIILGAGATKTQIAAENAKVGWDESLLSQLGGYFGHLAHGNLGTSIIDGHPIGSDLLKRLPVTGLIALLATLVSGVAGLMLGMAAAVRSGHTDRAINVSSGVALSLPSFWIGVLLVYVFAVWARVLPATGYVSPTVSPWHWLQSIALPVIALSVAATAVLARTARASVAQALVQPHVRMLRSLGTPRWRLLFVHVLRNASVPVVSVLAIQFVAVFSGSIIIEGLFALPGLGQAASAAVTSHDYPAVEGVVIISSIVVVVMSLLLDLLVAVIDPRVRTS